LFPFITFGVVWVFLSSETVPLSSGRPLIKAAQGLMWHAQLLDQRGFTPGLRNLLDGDHPVPGLPGEQTPG
jgi:hypothetical protein